MELIHKTIDFQVREVGDPTDRVLEFVGSTADVDRYGDIIEVEGWDLKNFKKNSPFLWVHNYVAPPVGTVVKAFTDERGLICHTYFPTDEEIAVQGWPSNIPTPETVYRLYKIGSLKATSVGFAGLEREPIIDKKNGGQQTGWRYLKSELYELSAVPVPANPYAVIQQAVQKGVISEEQARVFQASDPLEEKGVIPYKEYPTDEPGAAWDGPAEIKAAEVSDLKKMCAWFDSENPDIKNSYKLPHHRAKGYNTVWKGVSAAMGALLGARGGVNIPDADRKGVYNHLAKHYAQFQKTPPEFKNYMEIIESLEAELAEAKAQAPKPFTMSLILDEKQLEAIRQDVAKQFDFDALTKAGAVLSAKNKAALKDAQALIQQVLDAAEPVGNEGKAATSKKSIYSPASNPGPEPEGERRAERVEVDMTEIRNLTKNLHTSMCPDK
jgi:hypothetical protein